MEPRPTFCVSGLVQRAHRLVSQETANADVTLGFTLLATIHCSSGRALRGGPGGVEGQRTCTDLRRTVNVYSAHRQRLWEKAIKGTSCGAIDGTLLGPSLWKPRFTQNMSRFDGANVQWPIPGHHDRLFELNG